MKEDLFGILNCEEIKWAEYLVAEMFSFCYPIWKFVLKQTF